MKVNRHVFNFYSIIGIAFAFWICLSSCGSTKNLRYFNDLPDSTHVFLPPMNKGERVIEYGDHINIFISAEEKDAVAYFNTQGGASTGTVTPGTGYLVDPLGYIEFPIIGRIKVLGLTERQLKENLTQLIGKYVKDPLVDIRFNTFKVTILGEVNGPGTFTLDMQRTTIFQALAAAGDLPVTAKRYDISLYRDYNGERSIIKIDLRKKEVLYNSEVFEMRHNDVIYVQPSRNQLFRDDFSFFTSMLGLVAGLVSLVVVIINNN
ncbi:MAG: polysaccharide biosynthesis/export family protein [Flavitalea sp.]